MCVAQAAQLERIVASEASTDTRERLPDSHTKRFLGHGLVKTADIWYNKRRKSSISALEEVNCCKSKEWS